MVEMRVGICAVMLASACTVGRGIAEIDARAQAPDGGVLDIDAPPSSFDCFPFETGIFVAGSAISGQSARRVLGSFDPHTSQYHELADVGTCIEGWYIRAMTVSRDGFAYFLLANQTIAVYGIESGSCDAHMLERSSDDGIYSLATFIGDGSSSSSIIHERLQVVFTGYAQSETELLIDLDRASFVETPGISIHNGGAILSSLVGTQDGRLFAARGTTTGSNYARDVVQLDRSDGSFRVVATAPVREETWLRSAVALWDDRIFVFDATATPTVQSTVSEVDRSAGAWSAPLLSLDQFEVEAVSTTTCVGVDLF